MVLVVLHIIVGLQPCDGVWMNIRINLHPIPREFGLCAFRPTGPHMRLYWCYSGDVIMYIALVYIAGIYALPTLETIHIFS